MKDILGVKIDNLGEKEILEKVEDFLNGSEFHQVATINPEFVLRAQEDDSFQEVLNGCGLCVADGFGVRCAFWRNLSNLKCRMTGVDLAERILKIAEKRGMRVFLACRKDGLSKFSEVKEALLEKYPRLVLFGDDIDLNDEYQMPNAECQILLCNFGSPMQEVFINEQKNDIMRLGIGVGGAFDFWTGKIKRAPKWMQKIGLEWLWRFFQEPRYRAKRIFRSVIVFPIKVIFKK